MRRIKAKAVYSLSTPDGREVGTLFETRNRQFVVQLDLAFHQAAQGEGTEARPAMRLVVKPIDPA